MSRVFGNQGIHIFSLGRREGHSRIWMSVSLSGGLGQPERKLRLLESSNNDGARNCQVWRSCHQQKSHSVRSESDDRGSVCPSPVMTEVGCCQCCGVGDGGTRSPSTGRRRCFKHHCKMRCAIACIVCSTYLSPFPIFVDSLVGWNDWIQVQVKPSPSSHESEFGRH